MAHELDIQNGKAAFAHVGERGWHGLGQKLSEDASIDVWRVEAGMGWTAQAADVMYSVKSGNKQLMLKMPDRKLLYRSDNHAALSVVSNKFNVVQPGDTLDFYQHLIKTAGFKLETAGVLFGGRKFFALARCGKNLKVMGEDEVAPYLLLATACDGSMATCAHFTSVRVVCNNTLRMAIGAGGKAAKVRVPHNAVFDPESVRDELGIVDDLWSGFERTITRLAKTKLSRDEAIDFIAEQLKMEGSQYVNREEMMEDSLALRNIIRLFDGDGKGASFKSSKGTAWGLLNAVTEYYDHHAGAKNTDRSRAFERAHLTDHATFKVQTANELFRMAA